MADKTISASGYTNNTGLGNVGGSDCRPVAQQFTLDKTYGITSASVAFAGNTGSPSGQVTYRIETDSSNLPSGTLANASLTALKTITPNADNAVTYPLTYLDAGKYWLVLTCSAQSSGNYWTVKRDNTGNPYTGGFAVQYVNGTPNTFSGIADLYFSLSLNDTSMGANKWR